MGKVQGQIEEVCRLIEPCLLFGTREYLILALNEDSYKTWTWKSARKNVLDNSKQDQFISSKAENLLKFELMHFKLCNLALNPNEVARKMACTRWYNYMKLSLNRNFAMFISIRQTLFCYKASLTHWVHFKTTLYIASLTICKNMSAPGVAITRQRK